MGNDKVAIRQNVLDGDNLPNAILNAVIAGFDVATVVNDTVEVLQQGDTTTYMFEATPDAIEHFAETFLANVRLVAEELRGYEYIDKPVIRRLDAGADSKIVRPDADAGQDAGTADMDAEDGIEIESADEPALVDELDLNDVDMGPDSEETIRKVGVADLQIKALLKHQRPTGDGRFEGKVVILFPNDLSQMGNASQFPAAVLTKQGVDDAELGQAVADYVLEFIARTADKYFDGMPPDIAEATLKFTGMAFSRSNERALVSTFEVGGAR